MKRLLFHLGFAVFLIAAMMGLLSIRGGLVDQAEKEFDVVPLMIFDFIFPVVFGMLFALPFLWRRYKEGRWKGFTWPEFIGIGVPSLFVTLSHWLFYTNFPMNPVTKFFAMHAINGPLLFAFIFGFTLIYSIRKREDAE
ncbi:hypothetical protein LC065_13160 [Halobacillus litoralis]|uniref:hypothetical protein n=1 Tax=Halobacillus litoralis TaxID=45668 RepID=UPI001CFCBF5F|nr:hypothetical protein [Halobacillus litoralis]WLR46517.1 hypothetical protein LC065_13160 [Halobacillus litoralis]